jgi:hypothetical protein
MTFSGLRRPILVTGAHRSGTSWVGEMLACSESPSVGYIYEPFNPKHRPGVFAAPTPCWFCYVCGENERAYLRSVRETLSFHYGTSREIRSIRSYRDVGRLGRDWVRFRRYRRESAIPLLKDPIALFSAQWLAERFGVRVVVLIRHPAGFVNSLKVRGPSQLKPFGDFLAQPLLMRDHLSPFEGEIRDFAARERSVVQQGILLWNLLYSTVVRFRERHPDWTFLRLEDIARNPVREFRDLFGRLELGFDESVERTIEDYSAPTNPAETLDPSVIKRDSRRAVFTWKDRLTSEEIDRIRHGVQRVAAHFYSDAEWSG